MGIFASCIINCESKCEGTIDDENWRPEKEYIELDDIVFPYALGSPRAMMVIALDADITVSTMKGLFRHVESALPAKTT